MADRQPVPEPTDEEWNRFWSYVRNAHKQGCWVWIGGKFSNGYGAFVLRRETRRAHRVLYVWENGEPEQDLDHLCNNRACVRPDHLRPFPKKDNVLRGEGPTAINARKTHCDNGHPLSGENLYIDPKRGWRQCRICKTAAALRSQDAHRDEINARRRERRVLKTYEPRACSGCEDMFLPDRSTARYCSKKCKWRTENHQRRATSS